jgi:hypothetical protein
MSSNDLIFTRYLYVKDEVELSLLVSILNKSDDSMFWAYELYYSGFKQDLINLIWKIYYDFFATLNPTFEAYLLKKFKELLSENDLAKDRIVSSIIQDLLFRPFNTDVFFLRNICSLFEIDIEYGSRTENITDISDFKYNMIEWIANNDYRSMSQWILNVNKNININDVYNTCLDIFELTNPKLIKEFTSALKTNINANIILLAKIMCFISKKKQLKKGKSIYINVEAEDIVMYETMHGTEELKHYKVLEKAYICGIDDLKHLSLFKLKRNKYNLKEIYWHNWEYYASFSPLWLQRINQFEGIIDYTNKTILFEEEPTDDLQQEFYGLYGLEPDEQKQEIQNKSIMKIEKKHDWKYFNDKYKNNGLFDIYEEELDEFDIEGIFY